MNIPEPDRTPFDLCLRLRGVSLRIQPLFLLSSAALGIRCYADPEDGSLGYFAFWIVAALVCVFVHALGQALVGRLFGIRCGIVLDGLGSQIVGVESSPRLWQRVSVLLAGPAVSFLLVTGI